VAAFDYLRAMSTERLIRRYAAFFKGWCQAFGNHRGGFDENRELNWLYGEDDDQIGLILTRRLRRLLYREILARHETQATLLLSKERIGIGRISMTTQYRDEEAMRSIRWLMEAPGELHLYQTYHLFYPAGTRILTLSRKAPLPIIYKPVDPIMVTLI
jgi:hypothetical protein